MGFWKVPKCLSANGFVLFTLDQFTRCREKQSVPLFPYACKASPAHLLKFCGIPAVWNVALRGLCIVLPDSWFKMAMGLHINVKLFLISRQEDLRAQVFKNRNCSSFDPVTFHFIIRRFEHPAICSSQSYDASCLCNGKIYLNDF